MYKNTVINRSNVNKDMIRFTKADNRFNKAGISSTTDFSYRVFLKYV